LLEVSAQHGTPVACPADVQLGPRSNSGPYGEDVACLQRIDPLKTELMHSLPSAKLLFIAKTACFGMASAGSALAAPGGANAPAINDAVKQYFELDANADGRVTEVEVLQDRGEKFKKLDVDGDGAITLEEVRALFSEVVPDTASQSLKERGVDDLSVLFIDSMDENDDGRVELFEFQRPARKRFRQIDANTDGFATPGETTVFFSRMRL
jgi:hypothetical protein